MVGEVPSTAGLSSNGKGGRVYVDSRLASADLVAVRASRRVPARGILPGDLLVMRRSEMPPGSLALATQGRRVMLFEIGRDAKRARPLAGDPSEGGEVRLRGPIVAVVRCDESLEE